MAITFFKPWRNECSKTKSCISLCHTPNSTNEGQSPKPEVHRTKILLCKDFSPRHLKLSYYPLLPNGWKALTYSFSKHFQNNNNNNKVPEKEKYIFRIWKMCTAWLAEFLARCFSDCKEIQMICSYSTHTHKQSPKQNNKHAHTKEEKHENY